MPAELNIELVPSELAQIVESVFETMLSLPAAESEAPWFPSADRLTAAVHFTGDWNGAVLFECSHDQACRFAGRFLAMDTPEAVDDYVRDVLGELANMIGGNMKCVLTRGIHLSMPSVIEGCDYAMRVRGAEVGERLAFQCEEGVVWVTVLTSRP